VGDRDRGAVRIHREVHLRIKPLGQRFDNGCAETDTAGPPTDRHRCRTPTDKITALRRDRVREAVGRLDPDQLADLDRALLIVLGLAR
jgi:hypothetical protein